MNKFRILMLTVWCSLMCVGVSLAVPQIGNIDVFDGSYADWNEASPDFSINNTHLGSLTITTTGNGVAAGEGITYTLDPAFVGDYAALYDGAEIRFNLASPGSTPHDLALYFNATDDNGTHSWMYSFSYMGGGLYTAGIGLYSGGWIAVDYDTPFGVDWAADFASAIAGIDQIGIYVRGRSAGLGSQDIFYLSDFEIGVPEPETVWMILAVLLSLGVTFRSQLAGMAGQVKARVLGG